MISPWLIYVIRPTHGCPPCSCRAHDGSACLELTPEAEVGGVFMRRVSEGLSVRRAGRWSHINYVVDYGCSCRLRFRSPGAHRELPWPRKLGRSRRSTPTSVSWRHRRDPHQNPRCLLLPAAISVAISTFFSKGRIKSKKSGTTTFHQPRGGEGPM